VLLRKRRTKLRVDQFRIIAQVSLSLRGMTLSGSGEKGREGSRSWGGGSRERERERELTFGALVLLDGLRRSDKEVTDRFIWLGRWILGRCVR